MTDYPLYSRRRTVVIPVEGDERAVVRKKQISTRDDATQSALSVDDEWSDINESRVSLEFLI